MSEAISGVVLDRPRISLRSSGLLADGSPRGDPAHEPVSRRAQAQSLRQNNPPGKSLLIFRNGVKPKNQKYSASLVAQITGMTPPVSPDERGGSRSSRTRGGMRWTRSLANDERRRRGRRSRVVLAPRRWRQVRGKQNFSRAMVARKPGHQGERGVSRNPSRRESRTASAEPVCSCAFFVSLCTRDRGCSAHPAFPAPSRCFRGREFYSKARAKCAARSRRCDLEIAKPCTLISPPTTRPCAWRGPRRAKLALEVGGGGSISLLLWQRVCRGTPHPRPLPAASRGEGSDEANDSARRAARWIASRSLSSGAHSRDPLARNDG